MTLRSLGRLVAATLLLSGCVDNPFNDVTYCRCPETEEAIASIDWFGDGHEQYVRATYDTNLRDSPPFVALAAEIDDPDSRAEEIASSLEQIGFEEISTEQTGWSLRLAREGTTVGFSTRSEDALRIGVTFDPAKPEAFADVAQVIGKVDEDS